MACRNDLPQIGIDSVRVLLHAAAPGEAVVDLQVRNLGGADRLVSAMTDIPGSRVLFRVRDGARTVEADGIPIPARSTAVLDLSGSHLLIRDLPKSAKTGMPFTMVLVFQKSGGRRLPCTLQEAGVGR